MPILKKKWMHQPCPYHAKEEDCPVCDDPICDCGNPGWACECSEQENDEEDCNEEDCNLTSSE